MIKRRIVSHEADFGEGELENVTTEDGNLTLDIDHPDTLDPGDEGEEVQELRMNLFLAGEIADGNTDVVGANDNLIENSNDFTHYNGFSGADIDIEEGIEVEEWGTEEATRITAIGGDTELKLTPRVDVGYEKETTYSVWMKNDGENPIRVSFNGLRESGSDFDLDPGEEMRHVATGTTREDYDWFQTQYYNDYHDESDMELILWREKAEYGEEATPWIPHIDDLSDEYDDDLEDKVRDFQNEHDLEETGVADERTMIALASLLSDDFVDEGVRTSDVIDISDAVTAKSSVIEWDADGDVTVETSIDGGENWEEAENGSSIPSIDSDTDLNDISFQTRQTLRTDGKSELPQVHSLDIEVVPQPREMEGDFTVEVTDYRDHINASYPDDETGENYPQDGEDFVIPTRDEMEALMMLGIRMKNNRLTDAQRIIDDNEFPFEIIHYHDEPTEQDFRMLREFYEEGYHKGWGMFVWNEQPQLPWTVQVTHPIFDEYTPDVGGKVFVAGAYAFFMHGTHRYSYPSVDDQGSDDIYSNRIAESDPSGTDLTPMHAFQLAESRRNNVFFQIHGFTKSNPGRGNYPAVIVSEGATASPASIRTKAMANELSREGMRAGVYNFDPDYNELTMYNDLGAETNRGGAWTDGLLGDEGKFLHLEIETTLRFNSPNFTADAVIRAGRRVYPHMDTFLDPDHNLTNSPALDTDSDGDGIADDWVENDTIWGETEYEVDDNEQAQMVQITETDEDEIARAGVDQTVSISTTGIPYKFTVETMNAQVVDDFQSRIYISWEDSDGENIAYSSAEVSEGSTDFIQLIGEDTPPNDATQARILLEAEADGAGSSGIAWFKNCRLYKREDKFFTKAMMGRFHDADPSKVDIVFTAPLSSAGDPSDWDSDITIESATLKDHGFVAELEVSGTERGQLHYFALSNGIEDEHEERIRSNRVFVAGVSEDDLFTGESIPPSRIRKNLDTFPILDVWDKIQTSGANIVRTRHNHSNLFHEQPGPIIAFLKRSDEFIFTHYQHNVEPQEELWFKADIYIPDWYEQEGRSLYLARISENEDNIDDGIRLNLTYDDDGDLFWQLRDVNGSGTNREPDKAAVFNEWQTVEFVCRVGQEVEHSLYINGEEVASRDFEVDVDSLEHIRVGTTYGSETELEQLELFMKGIKISKTRYGVESHGHDHIFKPLLMTELLEINQQANWTHIQDRRDLREIEVGVPVNLNGGDVRVNAWLENEYGEVLDSAQSEYAEQGIGSVTLEFNDDIQPGTFLRFEGEDEDGNVGEMNTYNYVYIPPVEPTEMGDADVVTIRNQAGDMEGLVDVYDFERSMELNDDYKISFSVPSSSGNYQSFHMLENENVIQFQGEDFRIKRVERFISNDMPIKEIEARHTFFDSIDDYVYEELSETLSIEDAVEHALDSAEISYEIEGEFDTVLFDNFGDDTALGLIQEITDRYGAEFKITGNNSVLITNQIGGDSEAQFRHKHNVETIDYYIDTSELSTYIEGYGAKDQDTGEYAQTAYYTSPNADMYTRADGSVRLKHAPPVRDDRYEDYDSLRDRLEEEIKDEPEYSIEIEVSEIIRNLDNEEEYSLDDFELGDSVFVIYEPLDIDMDARVVKYVDYPMDNIPPVVTIGNFRMDGTRLQAGSGTSLGGSGGGSTDSTSGTRDTDVDLGDVNLYNNEIRANDYMWMDNLGIHQQNPDDQSQLVFHGPTGSTFDRMIDVNDDQDRQWIDDGNFAYDAFTSQEREEWLPDIIPSERLPTLDVTDTEDRHWIDEGEFNPDAFSSDERVEWLPDEIPMERLPEDVQNGGGIVQQETIIDPLSTTSLDPDQATLFNADAKTRYVSFAIRFEEETDFTLEVAYRADESESVILRDYEEKINEEGVTQKVYKFEPDFPHIRFRLRNTGDEEVEVEHCQIGFIP